MPRTKAAAYPTTWARWSFPGRHNAVVPSKQDNIHRGTLRSGANLNFQNTVRAIASFIDPGAGEVYSRASISTTPA